MVSFQNEKMSGFANKSLESGNPSQKKILKELFDFTIIHKSLV
jgi:hypothetical protein